MQFGVHLNYLGIFEVDRIKKKKRNKGSTLYGALGEAQLTIAYWAQPSGSAA